MIDLLFHVLLGTPRGLNLRNLVWHGFASQPEISPELTAAVIVLILTISPAVVKATFDSKSVRSKHLSDLKQVEPMVDVIRVADVITNRKLSELMGHCDQLSSGKTALMRLAIDRYEARNFRVCLNILLPEFEFLLRYLLLPYPTCYKGM